MRARKPRSKDGERTKPFAEDVGAMGQHYLALLAKSAGLVANASTDDKAGWDFELEQTSPTSVDYHSHSRPLYRIQVKASAGSSLAVSMTYSNLLSLIQFSGPAFLFLVRFDRTATTVPIEARLLHVDEAMARGILTKMRRREVKDQATFKINKTSTSINFHLATPVDLLDGSLLRAALAKATEPGYLDYVRDKTRWLRNLEHEAHALRFNVHFENEAAIAAMADALLGLETEVRADVVSYRAPMGIPSETPKHKGEFRPMGIGPAEDSIRKATVRLRAREFGATYAFAAKLYSNSGLVPPQFEGMRLHTTMFDIVVKREPLDIHLVLANVDDSNFQAPVRDLRNFIAYLDEASQKAVIETFLEIDLNDGAQPLRVSPSSHATVSSGHHELRLAYDALYGKLESIGLGDATIKPALYWSLPGNFTFVQHVGTTYSPDISFEFDGPEDSKNDVNAVIFTVPIELVGVTVFFFGVFFGRVERRAGTKFLGTFTHSAYGGEVVVRGVADPEPVKKTCGERLQRSLEVRGFRVL